MLPPRIRLVPRDTPAWKREPEVGRLMESLRALGFGPVGLFDIPELPRNRMQTLLLPSESVIANITEHDRDAQTTLVLLELVMYFRDGTTLTHTTANIPEWARSYRPGHDVVYSPGTAAADLYDRLLRSRPPLPLRPVAPADFPALFETGYAHLVAWRRVRDLEADYAELLHDNRENVAVPLSKVGPFQEAIATLTTFARAYPTVRAYRTELARWYNGLGLLYTAARELEQADAAYRDALTLAEPLVREPQATPEDAILLGRIYLNRANRARDAGRPEAGLAGYAKAVQTLGDVRGDKPVKLAVRTFLRHAHRSRARALDQLGRHAEAVDDWDLAVELDDRRKPGLRWQRALTLARAGEAVRAIREGEALAAENRPSLRGFFDLARVYALCAAAEGNERHASRALELLRRAAGRRRSARLLEPLRTDDDLAGLRPREEFQEIVRQLVRKTRGAGTSGL